MTNAEILEIALRQSAWDCNCEPGDFLKATNTYTVSVKEPKARKYLPLPFACDLVSYGSGVVAQCREDLIPLVREFLEKYPSEHVFETPHIYALNDRLAPYGLKVCYMAEYFLPDMSRFQVPGCDFELRTLGKDDFGELYLPQWSNALCEARKELDVLGVGAFDGEKLVGFAGCSADCEDMYQIGVDVLPEYRGRGIAPAVTGALAQKVFEMGKLPFYCAAWCNIKSVRNAVRCGFRPAWVELTAREISHVEEMNR